jgi:hypothetical protein
MKFGIASFAIAMAMCGGASAENADALPMFQVDPF